MSNQRCRYACWVLIAGSVFAAARAEDTPVYTNADLERFPALPSSTVVAETPSAEDWQRFVDYLDRQYARIDADRAHALERRRIEFDADRVETGRVIRPWRFGVWPLGWVPPVHSRTPPGSNPAVRRPAGRLLDPVSWPSSATRMRDAAARRSGADAFPSRSR